MSVSMDVDTESDRSYEKTNLSGGWNLEQKPGPRAEIEGSSYLLDLQKKLKC